MIACILGHVRIEFCLTAPVPLGLNRLAMTTHVPIV